MRLLLDMNLTPLWVDFMIAQRLDAAHWSAIGDAGAPDDEICHANDLDFPLIPSRTRNHAPSVVLLRGYPLSPEIRGHALVRALRQCETDLAAGAIVSITLSGRPRIRSLPI